MDNLPVNVFDIIVGVALLSSAALAYARGFVHETLSILGWVGAVVATVYGYPYLRPYATEIMGSDIKGDVATGVVIFVVTLAILSLASRAISKQVQESALNAVDRSLGFLFGIARGALILCVVYMAVDWFAPRFPELSADEQADAAKEAKQAKRDGKPYDDPRFGWPNWVEDAKTIRFVAAGANEIWAYIPDETFGEAKSEAEQARERARRLLEAERSFREMVSPTPKAKEGLQKDGYGAKERSELDRLLNQSTGSGSASEVGRGTPLPANPLDNEH